MARVAAIVLAAGRGRRIGGPKMLLPIGEGTFLTRILNRISEAGISPVVTVVAERDIEAVMAVEPGARLAINHRPEDGMLSSIRAGIAAVIEADGFLVIPVDHPAVLGSTYRLLAETFERDPSRVVRPVYEGRAGHPVIIPGSVVQATPDADVAGGLAEVIRVSRVPIIDVSVDDPGILKNVNTKGDLDDGRGVSEEGG